MLKWAFFYGGFVAPLFALAFALLAWRKDGMPRFLAVIALICTFVFTYARLIEPQWLQVKEHTIVLSGAGYGTDSVKVALVADMHYGVFPNSIPFDRILAKIENANVDAIMLAGDYVYYADLSRLPEYFEPLSKTDVPIYAVLGNHDVGQPGIDVSAEVEAELKRQGVIIVENTVVDANLGGRSIQIAGVSDIWARRHSYNYIDELDGSPLLFIAHNPDAAYEVPASVPYDLMLSGHTHGGQIRIPGLVHRVIPTKYRFDREMHVVETTMGERKVFVTSGTGMTGFPMRFRMPPRIDILNIQMSEE